MELKAVRGMHDLFGEELARWNYVENKVRETFKAFGYQEIRTPVLEKIEVFSQSVGEETDIVEKQMYTVLGDPAPDADVKGEKMVLRPEGTSSFIRAVIEHNLHRTAQAGRYFYYMPMFRHERPQKGRLRQFHQFGAELILDPSPEADSELILLLDQVYKSFSVTEYEIRVNSVGCNDCRPIYKEALKNYFRPHLAELCEQCQKRFERSPLRILDCKRDSETPLLKNAPKIFDYLCATCVSHHGRLKECLKEAGVAYIEDPNIVRGLDYYMRTAFEFTSNLLGAQSALGGGGRYDGLAARFGEPPLPAVGFALGMERLMLVLEQKNALPDLKRIPAFFLAPLGEAAYRHFFKLSFQLKRQGITAEMTYDAAKGLKWLMKQADRVNARYAVILGDTELAAGQVQIKDMKAGTQETISLSNLDSELIRRAQLAL